MRAIIRQKPAHLLMRDGGLHDGGECEAEDQRPEDLPSHGQRHFQCAYDCIDHSPLPRFDLQRGPAREARDPLDHHRNNRDPSIAPTRAQSRIDPPYHSAINGMEPPGWWNVKTAAPSAPATSPAIAPVRIRLVGAPLRNAQMSDANGTTANNGMQIRQTAHCGPKIMPLQAAGCARTRATPPAELRARNKMPIRISGLRPGSPGRPDPIRKLAPAKTNPSVNAIARTLGPE